MKFKFESIREMIDHMSKDGSRWLVCDSPATMMIGYVKEDLSDIIEISFKDQKETYNRLSIEERESFEMSRFDHARLVNGVSLTIDETIDEEYKLSSEYKQSLANFLVKKVKSRLEKESLLRKNATIENLPHGALPVYDMADQAYIIDDDTKGMDLQVTLVKNKTRVHVPMIEISSYANIKVSSVWGMNLDKLYEIAVKEMLDNENTIYKKICLASAGDFKIVVPIRQEIQGLYVDDWKNGKIGVSIFEILGVVAFEKIGQIA